MSDPVAVVLAHRVRFPDRDASVTRWWYRRQVLPFVPHPGMEVVFPGGKVFHVTKVAVVLGGEVVAYGMDAEMGMKNQDLASLGWTYLGEPLDGLQPTRFPAPVPTTRTDG
jgi:hypothetical protein